MVTGNFLTYNGKKVIVISFGNPYLMENFPEVPAYICAYGDSKPSIIAAVKSLIADIRPNGKLPVTINENYKFGHGLTYAGRAPSAVTWKPRRAMSSTSFAALWPKAA